jgi:hypothetical protein
MKVGAGKQAVAYLGFMQVACGGLLQKIRRIFVGRAKGTLLQPQFRVIRTCPVQINSSILEFQLDGGIEDLLHPCPTFRLDVFLSPARSE